MLSLREAIAQKGGTFHTSLRALAAEQKLPASFSLKHAISACLIDRCWRDIGGIQSPIGRSMTTTLSQNDGTFARFHRGGEIRTRSDTGQPEAYHEHQTSVYFKKIVCVKQSNELSDNDEIYGVLAVYAPESGNILGLKKIPDAGGGHYSMDDGDVSTEGSVGAIWVGPPQPMKVVCVLMEQDWGNEAEIKQKIQDKLQEIANGAFNSLGLEDAEILKEGIIDDALKVLSYGLASIAIEVFGLADDKVGYAVYPPDKPYINYEEFVNPNLHPDKRFTFGCRLGSKSEGIYEVHFEVVTKKLSDVIG